MKKSYTLIASLATAAMLMSSTAYAQQRNAEAALPPPGKEVNLNNFDSYMKDLEGQITERLGQLSPSGGDHAPNNGLDRPSTDEYKSDLEIMSKVQRDTKVLEAMLAKARLAKQVWAEVHSNPTEEYQKQIAELESNLMRAREETRVVSEEYEQRLQTAAMEREDIQQRYQEAEMRIQSLQSQIAEQNTLTPSGNAPLLPKISSVVKTGPRFTAILSMPDGRRVEVSEGDTVSPRLLIGKIEANEVFASRNGSKVWLEKGSYQTYGGNNSNQYAPPPPSNVSVIDNAASFANN
ncbi:hypothetical protein [Sulfitobacter sp. R18_1]|uniref:hypothetical protein n=1 Tax=Sulfitobacter sp. R18_1 TaxID=2821104 RepID=UPI001ADC1EF3|nr:hypothetical protein [Sulfitobacter sp. R18_1]MBO9428539.1 hypothetical protein [Sulfitobacter sp. R18_1]